MPRLIDANALLKSLQESHKALQKIYDGLHFEIEQRLCGAQITTFIEAILRVKHAPTIDAEPVRHGRWIYYKNHAAVVQCTECGLIRNIYKQEGWHYCPNCGAKMDGGAEE